MRIKIKDENKMRKFIDSNIEGNISNEDFNNWLDYLQETADYIEEIEQSEESMIEKIRQGSSLSLTIDDEEYEVNVKLNRLVDNKGIYFEVDMDYDYFYNYNERDE